MKTIYTLYIIWDNKAGDVVGIPTFHRNLAAAMRWFENVINLPNSPALLNPKDYDLLDLMSLKIDSTDNASRIQVDANQGQLLVVNAEAVIKAPN